MSLNSNALITKLVRKNLSILRIATFCCFSTIGFFILLLTGTMYFDYAKKFGNDSSIWKTNYIVISKNISALQTLIGQKPNFTQEEIDELKNKSFVQKVGNFQSSQFPVRLQLGAIGGIKGLSTDLFLESIPEQFIDVNKKEWSWKEEDSFIPIIIPKNYLNLYNFGFATSQGLPQISEDLFKQIPFQLIIGKDERQKIYQAKIIDFTTKVNTILVPENFLSWANNYYSNNKENPNPSRIIVETKPDGEENSISYFDQHNYDINKDELKNNELTYYLKLVFSIVLLIGLIIVLAAIWLMIINFQFMMEKNKRKTKDLFLIGYSINQLARPYLRLSLIFITISYLISIFLIYYTTNLIGAKIGKFIQLEQSSKWTIILFSTLLVVVVHCINLIVLKKSIKKIILK